MQFPREKRSFLSKPSSFTQAIATAIPALLTVWSANAQNPSHIVNEPDYAPGLGPAGLGVGILLAVFLGAYVLVGWLILFGPARHWADENKGLAALALWATPIVIGFLAIATLGAFSIGI